MHGSSSTWLSWNTHRLSTPRGSWRRTIRLARLDIGRILEDSPSLKREISRLIEKETAGAVQLAILDLEEHGEIDQMEPPAIGKTSYTEQQVLGDWFPEESAAQHKRD